MTMRIDLEKLTARELMTADVATIGADEPVREAVRLMDEYGVSGVPVVDVRGAPVGIITTRDVARVDHLRDRVLEDHPGEMTYADPEAEDVEREDYSPRVLGETLVRDWMRAEVVEVAPDASLFDICRVLRDQDVHRAVVVEDRRVIGVVSTMDIVRALA